MQFFSKIRSGWSSGMIPPLGGGGPGFNPRTRPFELARKIEYIILPFLQTKPPRKVQVVRSQEWPLT